MGQSVRRSVRLFHEGNGEVGLISPSVHRTSARKMIGGRQLLVRKYGLPVSLLALTLSKRTLNGSSAAGPVNTLSESHPAKRQRTSWPDTATPHAHVLNQDPSGSSSHDDTFDLRSTSSTDTMSGHPEQDVDEYRSKAQRKLRSGNTRKRKRRTPTLTTGNKNPYLESPDALAGHDLPPAADIVSDILHNSAPKRRSQRSDLMPPFKNHKPQAPVENIYESEDELLHEPNNDGKRSTNFSNIRQPQRQPQRRANFRGDIQPSSFSSPLQIQTRPSLDQSPMIVKNAACGRKSYESDGQQHKEITLRLEPSNSFELVPTTARGDRLTTKWLHIKPENCHSLQCAVGESPYAVIHRSRAGDADAKLGLEFTTIRGASALASCLSSVCEYKHP